MFCKKCNHKLPDDSIFCQYCGGKVNVELASLDEPTLADMPGVNELSPESTRDAVLKIQAAATAKAIKANVQSRPSNENDADFGLVPEKPIFTPALKSVRGQEEYLNNLRTVTGEKIEYTRRGSTSAEGVRGLIDIYDTFLPSGQPYNTIYINMYGTRKSNKAPVGFVLIDSVSDTQPPTSTHGARTTHTQTVKVKVKKHNPPPLTPVEEKNTSLHKASKNARFCSKCGSMIDAVSKKCTGCGKQYFKAKKFILILVSIILCVALLLAGGYFIAHKIIINYSNYRKAEQLYLDGNYHSAALGFNALGDYKDSASRAQECYEALIIDYAEAERYHALLQFVKIYGIPDTALTYLKEKTLEWINQKNYSVAYELIPVLENQPRIQEEVRKALYSAGWDHYVNEQYELSNEIFWNLGEYRDSPQLIKYDVLFGVTEKVTIMDLKNNPSKYDGKIIQLQAVVWTVGDFFYVVDKEYYSLYPNALISPRDFEDTRYVYVIKGYECVRSLDNLRKGEQVTIIGEFVYQDVGEEYSGVTDGGIVTLIRTESYAELRAVVIY